MNDLDKWAAEQCGVSIIHSVCGCKCGYYYQDKWHKGKWTLDDARCMAIADAHWSICTIIEHDICGWSIECYSIGQGLNKKIREKYKDSMYLLHDGFCLKNYRITHSLPELFAPEHIIQAKKKCIEAIKESMK